MSWLIRFIQWFFPSDVSGLSREDKERRAQRIAWVVIWSWTGFSLLFIGIYSFNSVSPTSGNGFRVFGHYALTAGAFGVMGALFGFLFGLPRTLANESRAVQAAASGGETAEDVTQRPNTNLEQVSDWLTKILVGLGISQLDKIPAKLGQSAEYFRYSPDQSAAFSLATLMDSLVLGFFIGYLGTRLVLAGAFRLADNGHFREMVRQAARKVDEVAREAPLPDDLERSDDAKVLSRAAIANIREIGTGQSVEKLLSDGKILFGADDYPKAEEVLRKALALDPDHPEVLFYLAYTLIQEEDPAKRPEAVTLLEKQSKQRNPKLATWKLLGYLYLWAPGKSKAKEAEEATLKYREQAPDDLGAMLNLACAYGQQGPGNPENENRLISLLRRLIAGDPGYRDRIRELTDPGEDFEAWKNVRGFSRLILEASKRGGETMPRPATRGGDLDDALAADTKDLMIIHGPAASTPAGRIYDKAVQVADPQSELVVQFDALTVLTAEEKAAWFPGGRQGFCVLDVVDRVPYSSGTLQQLMEGTEPSATKIRSAFNGNIT